MDLFEDRGAKFSDCKKYRYVLWRIWDKGYIQTCYDDDSVCVRCGCCDNEWVDCWKCEGKGGRTDEDLMEEDPLWYSPGDFETCNECEGTGGWNVCIGRCDENGKHKQIST